MKNVCGVMIKVLGLSLSTLLLCTAACNLPKDTVDPQVSSLIAEKCAGCHSEKLVLLDFLTYVNYLGGCGGCHAPLPDDHAQSGCTSCHTTPEETHFNLRDAQDQTRLAADAGEACAACHLADVHHDGKGFPPMTSDDEILKYTRTGTMRSWIQPGGFMAKYLSDDETAVITNWIDRISENRTLDYDPYLDAEKIETDFDLNGKGDNTAWDAAPEHTVQLGVSPMHALSAVQPTRQVDGIQLKALYSDTHLYIRAEYDDPTLSMAGSGSWRIDNETLAWDNPPAASVYEEQYPGANVSVRPSQDRLAFLWNMTMPDFKDTYGCAAACHGNVPGSSFFTDAENSRADLWVGRVKGGLGHMSFAQSGIVSGSYTHNSYQPIEGQFSFSGHFDDAGLTWHMDIEGGYNTTSAGRVADEGSASFSKNSSASGIGPKYIESGVADFADAMLLTQAEIDAGEAIVADPADAAFGGSGAVQQAWDNYKALNALVPEHILSSPTGSRADVQSASTWTDGVWVHEFKRKLSTGNADDITFTPGGSYEFSLTVFNDCGWGEIPPMHNTLGAGQYQVLRLH